MLHEDEVQDKMTELRSNPPGAAKIRIIVWCDAVGQYWILSGQHIAEACRRMARECMNAHSEHATDSPLSLFCYILLRTTVQRTGYCNRDPTRIVCNLDALMAQDSSIGKGLSVGSNWAGPTGLFRVNTKYFPLWGCMLWFVVDLFCGTFLPVHFLR